MSLGRAYIEILADGKGFTGELTSEVDASLEMITKTAAAAFGEVKARMTTAFAEAAKASNLAFAEIDTRFEATQARADLAAGGLGAAFDAAFTAMATGSARAAAETEAGMSSAAASVDAVVAATGRADAGMTSIGASAGRAAAETTAAMTEAEGSISRLAAAGGKAGGVIAGITGLSGKQLGGAVAGFSAVEAVKSAGDLQSAITRLVTTAGEAPENFKLIQDGVLQMSGQVGVSAQDLAKGLYLIESSGQHGQKALDTLRASAQGAKQENADLSHVVDAVTTSMHDFGEKAGPASLVTSQLVTAVSHGKVTFDQLTGAMHTIEPMAAAAGMSIGQTAGALAAMTASGMSADQAATNLASSIRSFEKPTRPMIDELNQVGLSASDLTEHLGERGVAGTLQIVSQAILQHMGKDGQVLLDTMSKSIDAAKNADIAYQNMPPSLQKIADAYKNGSLTGQQWRDALKAMPADQNTLATSWKGLTDRADGFSQIIKSGSPAVQTYVGALGKAVGTAEGLQVALQLTGDNTKYANAAIDDISGTAAQADGNIKGWSEVQGTFNQRISEAWQGIKSFGTSIGVELLPYATAAASWFTDKGLPAIAGFTSGVRDAIKTVAGSKEMDAALSGAATGAHLLWDAGQGLLTVMQPLLPIIGSAAKLFGSLPGPLQLVVLGIAGLKAATATGLFTGMAESEGAIASSLGRTAGKVTTFRETYQLQMALADEANGALKNSAGSLAAAMEAAMPRAYAPIAEFAANTKLAMAEVRGSFLQAKSEAQGMAALNGGIPVSSVPKAVGDLKGLESAAGSAARLGIGALKDGAKGLMAMLGGPFGIAMMAGVTAITMVTSSLDKQKEAVKNAASLGQDLGNTYQSLGSMYGQQAANARDTAKSQAGLNDILKTAGVSQDTYTQALMGNKKAQQEIQGALDSSGTRWHALWSGQVSIGDVLTGNSGKWRDQAKAIFDGVNGNVTVFDHFNRQVSDGATALDSLHTDAERVFGKNNPFEKGLGTVDKGMQELRDSAGDTQKSLQGITDILNGLTGAGVSAADAQVSLTNANNAVLKSFQDSGGAISKTSHDIDLSTQAGADLYGRLKDVASGYDDAVNQAYAAAGGINNASEASKAAGKTAQTLYEKFIATATGAGMSRDAAEKLAEQLHLVPGDVVTKFTQPGMSAAQAAVQVLQGQVDVITAKPHEVTVKALTKEAEDMLTAVGLHVTHLPDGTVKIDADTRQADSALSNWLRNNATHVVTVGIAGRNDAAYTGTDIIVNGHHLGNADGNLVTSGMTPMAAGIAAVVPPGTLRVIGDNPVADEAFIPLNGSARSLAILAAAAARMGRQVLPMAGGGFLNLPSGPGWPAGATSVHVDVNPDAVNKTLGSTLTQIVQGIQAAQKAAAAAAAAVGGNAARWAPQVQQVIGMLGLPSTALGGILSLIQNESGGNPNAINLWDANAAAGHPSQGLTQTVPATFARWRSPALPNNILDPLANIFAGVNYALHTYGAQMLVGGGNHTSAGRYMGYAQGGLALMAGGYADVVPPGTPRVIGDNLVSDEAYIPLDGSARSTAIWTQAGIRMGTLGRAGSGGTGGGLSVGKVEVTYSPVYQMPPTASPEEVAAIVSTRLAADLHLGVGDALLGAGSALGVNS